MDKKVRDHKINELWRQGYSIIEAEEIVDGKRKHESGPLSGQKVADIIRKIAKQKASERKARIKNDAYEVEDGKFYIKEGRKAVRG